MKRTHKSMMSMVLLLTALILAVSVQPASAQPGLLAKFPILLGTTGACNNAGPGGPCTTQSRLVWLNPQTGALIKDIGPVGFTVNGLAWDGTSGMLYATTPPGDANFHGLITINPFTGKGKPVNKKVVNFGLAVDPGSLGSPIHSIAIDHFGHMVGWYDESPPPDTYVRIDQHTGIATEFPNTGINTSQNGVSFGEFNLLWNIDSPKTNQAGVTTQTAYLLNPFDGTALLKKALSPPTNAALGDFRPGTNIYYGLKFDTDFPPPFPTFIVMVDPLAGTVTQLGPTVDDLHTLTFVKGLW